MALTREQTRRLREVLDRRSALLIEEVRTELERSGEQHYIDLAGRVTDTGDQAVADVLADLGAAIIDRQVNEIRDIEAARRRIEAGTYGECLDCGTDIGFERLMAYPTAKRCIECQGLREKGYAHGGTPRL
jgi:RNA polymerase-binding transcription factor